MCVCGSLDGCVMCMEGVLLGLTQQTFHFSINDKCCSVSVCVWVHMHVCMQAGMSACTHMCMCACVCVCVCE